MSPESRASSSSGHCDETTAEFERNQNIFPDNEIYDRFLRRANRNPGWSPISRLWRTPRGSQSDWSQSARAFVGKRIPYHSRYLWARTPMSETGLRYLLELTSRTVPFKHPPRIATRKIGTY